MNIRANFCKVHDTILEAIYVLNEITFAKYVGCFQDTVYQNSAHLYNCSTKKCLHSNFSRLFFTMSTVYKVANLVLCGIAFI